MKKQARDRERSEIFMMLENHTLKKELALVPLYLQSHTKIVLNFYNHTTPGKSNLL